jgi:hypothetical protein
MFTDPLTSNGRPVVARVDSHGNVFTDPLTSNGRPVVARVDSHGNAITELLPRNGSTCHIINHLGDCHLQKDSVTCTKKINYTPLKPSGYYMHHLI